MSLIAWLSSAWMAVAVGAAVYLIGRPAPYGRHNRPGWGHAINHRTGWIQMEVVSPLWLLAFYAWAWGMWGNGALLSLSPGTFLLLLWCAHYLNRALVYPLRADWGGRSMPLAIAVSAAVFNAINGGLNGAALAIQPPTVGIAFVLGLVLFIAGAAINITADEHLLALRRESNEYRIPNGGLYRWVTCPNYLGEIIEWTGFALMAWNPAALSFAVWTAANLIPRALSHHRWYQERFADYPPSRKAVIPGLL